MTLQEFTTNAHSFMDALPKNDYIKATKPSGIYCGWRDWDAWKCMEMWRHNPTDVVLECGSWQTFLSVYLAQFAARVDATDSFYWTKRDFVKDQGLPDPKLWRPTVMGLGNGKIGAFYLDLQDMFVEDNAYDKITCISTIEHVHDDDRAMRELYRVLKPGGTLFLTTEYHPTIYKPYSEKDGSFYRIYDEAFWSGLLKPYPVIHREVLDGPMTVLGGYSFTTAFAVIQKPK